MKGNHSTQLGDLVGNASWVCEWEYSGLISKKYTFRTLNQILVS